jgi:sulfotransferase
MKKYHFISGLPRSGANILNSILNQNPKFHATTSNPLARFVRQIINESNYLPEYQLQCSQEKQIGLLQNLIDTYHSEPDKQVFFNTNTLWTGLLPALEQISPESRVICCVRDINEILNSFEKLFRSNPFVVSKFYTENQAETVYTRSVAAMTSGSPLRSAYDSLKEAITGYQKYMVMVLEYRYLTTDPESAMKSVYNFINEPYYMHDFENLASLDESYSMYAGIPGLYQVRKKVERNNQPMILPPDIINQFHGLEVWR